jgi:hypothetical protein
MIAPRPSPAVESMLNSGQLSRITADSDLAAAMLDRAQARLRSVRRALDADDLGECAAPLWDAVRLTCTALLQAQGLRTHGEGHHASVLEAANEQYGHILGPGLKPGRRLKESRRQAQYPTSVLSERLDATEIEEDVNTVANLIDASARLLPDVPVYRS